MTRQHIRTLAADEGIGIPSTQALVRGWTQMQRRITPMVREEQAGVGDSILAADSQPKAL